MSVFICQTTWYLIPETVFFLCTSLTPSDLTELFQIETTHLLNAIMGELRMVAFTASHMKYVPLSTILK